MDPTSLAKGREHVGAERFDSAVALTVNEGSWLLLALGDRTLGLYDVRVDLAGNVPADATAAYTVSAMADMFEKIEGNARAMPARYGPGCAPQPGGDGQPIPCFP